VGLTDFQRFKAGQFSDLRFCERYLISPKSTTHERARAEQKILDHPINLNGFLVSPSDGSMRLVENVISEVMKIPDSGELFALCPPGWFQGESDDLPQGWRLQASRLCPFPRARDKILESNFRLMPSY
jgi:hypothetical protein